MKAKKKVFTKNETLFSRIQVDLTLRCTPESNYWGDADVDHTQAIGGIQSNYWGIYPPLLGFGTPGFSISNSKWFVRISGFLVIALDGFTVVLCSLYRLPRKYQQKKITISYNAFYHLILRLELSHNAIYNKFQYDLA